MKQKKPNTIDFILCDMGIQNAFAQACRAFQKAQTHDETENENWLIIDNDTGEIITPKVDKASAG